MSRLTIETRLNILIGLLLLISLVANTVLVASSAGPRIAAESESVLRLTRQTIDRALDDMQATRNPQRDLAGLVERLAGIRHVRVQLDGGNDRFAVTTPGHSTGQPQGPTEDFGAIVGRLLIGSATELRIPVTIAGVAYGDLVVVADPSDEIAEIFEALTVSAVGGLILLGAIFVLTRFAVRQALSPIGRLEAALAEMQKGNFAIQMPAGSGPEFAKIGARVDALAAALSETRAENRRLAEALIVVEDQERRELARELHDELGPYLFAIRAGTTALATEAATDTSVSGQKRQETCRALLGHIQAVQHVNRRVLHRLRPPALSDIGLDRALAGLVAMWRENHPTVTITAAVELADADLDETTELTVYRVVQEGLTNAIRHADATRIDVSVTTYARGVAIAVRDDGRGRPDDVVPGFGLSGMRDRVWALGGRLSIERAEPSGGILLRAELPRAKPKPDDVIAPVATTVTS
jgi:two-component system sensor histidine kinase UhpB